MMGVVSCRPPAIISRVERVLSRAWVALLLSLGIVSAASNGRAEPGSPEATAPEAGVHAKLSDAAPVADEPLPDAPATDLEPASFHGITAGQSRLDEARKQLGQPLDESAQGDTTTLLYKTPPYAMVQVVARDDVVDTLILQLVGPQAADPLARKLRLDSLRAVTVRDASGQPLGRVFPERGVTLGFAADSPGSQVTHIMLQPITAEPFIARVQADRDHRYEQDLADLRQAQRLAPDQPRVAWLQAQLLHAIGRDREALQSIAAAVRQAPDALPFRLWHARLLAATENFEAALQAVEKLLKQDDLPDEIAAAAHCCWGDVLAHSPPHRYKQAIEHHQRAIELSAAMASDSRPHVRRTARQTLVEAHLAVADDIARGNWRRKAEVVPQWLSTARQLAKTFAAQDENDPYLPLQVHRRSLAALAGTGGQVDAAKQAETAVDDFGSVLAATTDRLYREKLQWELGEVLFDAGQIQQARGKPDAALKLFQQAQSLLEAGGKHRDATAQQDYLWGRLYYRIGSIYAVGRNDHKQAVAWYDRAVEHLARPVPRSAADDGAIQGQRLVSMGVSYWRVDARDRAFQVTKEGAGLIRQAVDDGTADSRLLAVPYSNLAAMNKQMGNQEEAQAFSELAAQARDGDGKTNEPETERR